MGRETRQQGNWLGVAFHETRIWTERLQKWNDLWCLPVLAFHDCAIWHEGSFHSEEPSAENNCTRTQNKQQRPETVQNFSSQISLASSQPGDHFARGFCELLQLKMGTPFRKENTREVSVCRNCKKKENIIDSRGTIWNSNSCFWVTELKNRKPQEDIFSKARDLASGRANSLLSMAKADGLNHDTVLPCPHKILHAFSRSSEILGKKTSAVKYKHCSLFQHKTLFLMMKKPLYVLLILPIHILCYSVLSSSASARNENILECPFLIHLQTSLEQMNLGSWVQISRLASPRNDISREDGNCIGCNQGLRNLKWQQQLKGGLQLHQQCPLGSQGTTWSFSRRGRWHPPKCSTYKSKYTTSLLCAKIT